ncbi:MAG: hypothetical protein H0W83_04370 [Planctomycetes bacterium]|nr:hypothetical protein [Planctomycetota bacterium]
MRLTSVLILALAATFACGGDAAPHAGVVSNVLVVSNHVEDVSSIEAFEKSMFKEGMTGEQKAIAIYDAIVTFGHFDPPPVEHSALDSPYPKDAIKIFNVYGYSSEATSLAMVQLARHAGMEARAWTVNKWGCVPEVKYDGAWHAMDPTMTCYFRNAAGAIASVEELRAGVKAWYEKNSDFHGNIEKIRGSIKDGGIAKGPDILKNGAGMNQTNGSFAFNYFGWYTAMLLYDGDNNTPFNYEESYNEGYRVNVQLRRGEVLTRRWSNTGLHVNMDGEGGVPETLACAVGSGVLYLSSQLGDLGNGRIGNGTLAYQMPATDADFQDAVLSADNAVGGATIHAKDAAKPASFVLRMPCSYIYLTGKLSFTSAGAVTVSFSDNNGLDWRELAKPAAGAQEIDLKSFAFRRYDYRLRFAFEGAGASITPPLITHDIQHSQRPLPALGQGENTIAFSAGPDEGTITIEGAGLKSKGKGPTFEDFHAKLENINKGILEQWGTMSPEGTGSVTYPVETPNDMKRLRFGCDYRAGGEGDGWDLQVSFDDGKTFTTVGRTPGPIKQSAKFVTCSDIPPKTRKALVRFSGASKGNTVLFRSRIDADYVEAHGAFAPVQVTYQWEENGQAKQDVHIATSAKDTYKISCGTKPKMVAVVVERSK